MRERTILVVEDDFVQRRQIARVLEEAGYNVSEASEGLEAIRLLDARKIHLVLTDTGMSGFDGISLLKYIKNNHPHVPVVVFTSHPDSIGDIKPDALLCKPFGEEELIPLVRRLTEVPTLLLSARMASSPLLLKVKGK